MVDIERATARAREIQEESGGVIGPTLAGMKAIEKAGVTDPRDVKRLGKEIAERISNEPVPPPQSSWEEDEAALRAKEREQQQKAMVEERNGDPED